MLSVYATLEHQDDKFGHSGDGRVFIMCQEILKSNHTNELLI